MNRGMNRGRIPITQNSSRRNRDPSPISADGRDPSPIVFLDDEGAVEGLGGGGAAEGHGVVAFVAQQIQHSRDAALSAGAESPHDGTPDRDGARAERDRLDDVGAAPDAAVE